MAQFRRSVLFSRPCQRVRGARGTHVQGCRILRIPVFQLPMPGILGIRHPCACCPLRATPLPLLSTELTEQTRVSSERLAFHCTCSVASGEVPLSIKHAPFQFAVGGQRIPRTESQASPPCTRTFRGHGMPPRKTALTMHASNAIGAGSCETVAHLHHPWLQPLALVVVQHCKC